MFEPTEALRVFAALQLAAVTLEHGMLAAGLLPPLAAAGYLAESGYALLRIRKLQLAVVAASAKWLATEAGLALDLGRRFQHLAAAAGQQLVGSVAALTPIFGSLRYQPAMAWTTSAPPPSNLTDLMRRLQTSAARKGCVRIEQLSSAGHREFVIYLPGTQNWSPIPGRTPFDLASDLRLYSGQSAPALTAVQKTLRTAGVGSKAGDTVTFVAHSQGAMIAAKLANQPEPYAVRAIITAGGPSGAMPVPNALTRVAIEHRSDIVPKLALTAQPETPVQVTAVIKTPDDTEAHDMTAYLKSAEGIDAGNGYAKVERLTQKVLASLASGGSVKVSQWQLVP